MRVRPALPFLLAAALLAGIASAFPPESATAEDDPALPVAPVLEPQRPGTVFYFFSPDWRPPDFGKLTVAFEAALGSGGLEISFQAFTRYDDFERQVRVQPPVFMIAPSWLEHSAAAALGTDFTVIARPLRRGKSTYRKALMTRSSIDSIDDLARGSIAATVHSMGSGEPAPVLDAFHLAGDSVRVVPVPKDVDALLALSFGQVDAALVTSEQYDLLAQTSPADTERMRVLAFSPEVGLPPVFASEAADPALSEKLQSLLARLPEVSEGPTVLAMLGVDGFVAETTAAAVPEPAPVAEPAPAPEPAAAARTGSAKGGVAKGKPPAKKKAAPRR